MFRALIVAWKRALSRVRLVPSFCKMCGRDVHDFDAPPDAWAAAVGDLGTVRCYDCFAEACSRVGIDPHWTLSRGDQWPT